MRKILIGAISIGLILGGVFAAQAQISPAMLWKLVGTALQPVSSAWTIGSSALRVSKGWFSDLDASQATFGVLSISGVASGNMHIGGDAFIYGGDINLGNGSATSTFAVSSGALTITAGGTNQNLTLVSSGTGRVALKPGSDSTTAIQLQKSDGSNVLNIDTTNGRVGIGTAAPVSKLQITDTNNSDVTIHSNTNTTGVAWLRFRTAATADNKYTNAAIIAAGTIGVTQSDLHFALSSRVDSTNVTLNDSKMVIKNGGNVGIGTTSPSQKLSVAGLMYIGGAGTSTIESNLNVMGTLHAQNSYVGDLVFKNGFRFTEDGDSLLLLNKDGKEVLRIGDNGAIDGDFGVNREVLKAEIKEEVMAELSLWDLIKKLFK